jgi:hypothetical protein
VVGVAGHVCGELEGDWLPAFSAALLTQADKSFVDVEVDQAKGEGATAACGGLGVQT